MLTIRKINKFLEFINKFNEALEIVGYNGRLIPITLEKKHGVIIGPSAKMIINHLKSSDKIDEYEEIILYNKNNEQKHKDKAFAIRFKN